MGYYGQLQIGLFFLPGVVNEAKSGNGRYMWTEPNSSWQLVGSQSIMIPSAPESSFPAIIPGFMEFFLETLLFLDTVRTTNPYDISFCPYLYRVIF